jgi:hypothetical protein
VTSRRQSDDECGTKQNPHTPHNHLPSAEIPRGTVGRGGETERRKKVFGRPPRIRTVQSSARDTRLARCGVDPDLPFVRGMFSIISFTQYSRFVRWGVSGFPVRRRLYPGESSYYYVSGTQCDVKLPMWRVGSWKLDYTKSKGSTSDDGIQTVPGRHRKPAAYVACTW